MIMSITSSSSLAFASSAFAFGSTSIVRLVVTDENRLSLSRWVATQSGGKRSEEVEFTGSDLSFLARLPVRGSSAARA